MMAATKVCSAYSVALAIEACRNLLGRKDMNWDQVEGTWKQYKGKVKEKWGKITDDDLDVIDGKRQQLIGKIQERYGTARNEAEKQADEFVKSRKAEDQEEQKARRPGTRS
jgi:uncharacterized protein YjbJ (UPF0337 family)